LRVFILNYFRFAPEPGGAPEFADRDFDMRPTL
jgi:hypothetical protein